MATLTFTAGDNGGSPILRYQVSIDDGLTWQPFASFRVVNGLTNGTAYAIRLRAVNALGAGAPSASTTVTPVLGLPDAPTGLTVVRGDGSVTVTFTPGGGDPTGYEVSLDGGATWAALPADGQLDGLTNSLSRPAAGRRRRGCCSWSAGILN